MVRKFDKIEITDVNHHFYGKQVYVLCKSDSPQGYDCILDDVRRYTTFVEDNQFEFIARPRRKDIPNHVLNYFN